MAVTAIRLYNFMAFQDTGWLELRPLTLLFGKNSSGKSAIIRALLLLRQSLDAPAEDGPLIFASEDGINLGSFERMIHGRELYEAVPEGEEPTTPKQMGFGFRCELPSWLKVVPEFDEEETDETSFALDFFLNFQWNNRLRDGQGSVELWGFSMETPDPSQGEESEVYFETFLADENYEQGVATRDGDQPKSNWYSWGKFFPLPFDPHSLFAQTTKGFFPKIELADSDAASALPHIRRLLEAAVEQGTKFLESINYLGPIRYEPQRYYFLPRTVGKKQEQKGLRIIRQYLTSADPKVEDEMNFWMKKLKLGEVISKHNLIDTKDVLADAYEIRIDQPQTVNLPDVGFGTSQVLPILLQAISSSEDEFLIIEQPELHLHPAAQAELADLFIKTSLKRKRRRFLLETHSEHLILRVLRRIRETTAEELEPGSIPISPSHVQVFHIGKDKANKSEAKLTSLSITDDGDFIDRWPGGFFPERAKELFSRIEMEFFTTDEDVEQDDDE